MGKMLFLFCSFLVFVLFIIIFIKTSKAELMRNDIASIMRIDWVDCDCDYTWYQRWGFVSTTISMIQFPNNCRQILQACNVCLQLETLFISWSFSLFYFIWNVIFLFLLLNCVIAFQLWLLGILQEIIYLEIFHIYFKNWYPVRYLT